MDEISRLSYVDALEATINKTCAPWSRMAPEEWAEEVYRLPNGGRFRWSYAPYTREMFRSLFDRRTIETSFKLYSRGLKSTVVLLAIGYTIDQAPRRILSLWPTNSQAEKFSKDNLCGELLDTTPPLRYLGNNSGRRISTNTLLHKLFPGGLIDLFGANAPGDMRRAKGSFLYAEEIDAIKTELTDEGDQLAIFWKRGDEYPDTIRVSASYPGVLGASRIQSKIDDSDGNQWFSTCVRCGGEPFVMLRSMNRFDKENPADARMECPMCHELLTDAERYQMAHGQGFENWRPQREFRGKRGFQANAMLWPHPVDKDKYPGGFLQMLAQQEIDASKSDNPKRSLRVLVNTVDAEPFDPTDENEKPPDWKPIYARREDYGLTVPKGGLFLTAFCDVQKQRLEIAWRAWGRNDESWGMDYVVHDGYVGHQDVWRWLRKELARKFAHESGGELGLGMAFVDGGAYAEDVYRFFRGLYQNPEPGVNGHCYASKGIGAHPHVIVTDGNLKTIAKTLKGRHIGTWQAKDRIFDRLRMTPEDGDTREGFMHYNLRYPEGWFIGLTVEGATQKIDGSEVYNTYKDEVTGNEPLDIEVGCLAAFSLRKRRDFDAIEAELREQVAAKEKPAEAPPTIQKQSNFATRGTRWRP